MRKIIQVDNDHVVFYELISIGNSTSLRDPVPHVLGEIHDFLHTKVPILSLLVWCMVSGLKISMLLTFQECLDQPVGHVPGTRA